MIKNRIALIFIALLLVVGVAFGVKLGIEYQTKRYADDQMSAIRANDFAKIYDNLSPGTQTLYKDRQDFDSKLSSYVFIKPDSSVKYVVKTGNLFDQTLYYQVVEKDDISEGYEVKIEVTGVLKKEIKDVTLQEVNFLKN